MAYPSRTTRTSRVVGNNGKPRQLRVCSVRGGVGTGRRELVSVAGTVLLSSPCCLVRLVCGVSFGMSWEPRTTLTAFFIDNKDHSAKRKIYLTHRISRN